VEILDGVPIPGYRRFEFRDPVGNRVGLRKVSGTDFGGLIGEIGS
jgi:hypothetical protein